jgi:diacylglycerol kinase (ATP)
MVKQELIFILNPVSGTQQKAGLPEQIAQHLDTERYTYKIQYTQYAGHARELAAEAAAAGVYAVVVAGGDGTVNEAGSALLHSETSLGILPFGSGNGLARQLQIPLTPVRAIQLLNHHRRHRIDAGMLNGRPFFCTAGLGFDAHVGQLFAGVKRRGFRTYVRIALEEFWKYKACTYSILLDEKPRMERRCFALTFANAGQYGNNAWIAPQAKPDDGLLDICMLKPFPYVEALGLGARLFAKNLHKSQYIDIVRAKSVEVKCAEARCMHLDGEYAAIEGPVRVEVTAQALQMLMPLV